VKAHSWVCEMGVYKSLYFLLSHKFSPDGELFCEYIMLQSCKSIFCYIELFQREILHITSYFINSNEKSLILENKNNLKY